MWVALVIIHGLLAVTLLGALTHQGVSVVWAGTSKRNFVERFAHVGSSTYVTAIIVLYVITMFFGAFVYASYRIDVRPVFEALDWFKAIGIFELKEHFITLGLAMLPTYWFIWKKLPLSQNKIVRTAIVVTLGLIVWYGFLVGHILNDLRGLGT